MTEKEPCQFCNDFGYYMPDVPVSDPRFGTAIPCSCSSINRVSKFLKHSGLVEKEYNYSLDHEPTATDYPKAVREAQRIIDEQTGMMIAYGNYGTGKTGLFQSVVATLCRSGYPAHYTTAADLLATVQDTFKGGYTEKKVDHYKTMRVLVIDEIESFQMTDWSMPALRRIIDYRYRERTRIATIFGTNVLPVEREGTWYFIEDDYPALGYLSNRCLDAFRADMRGKTQRGTKPDEPRPVRTVRTVMPQATRISDSNRDYRSEYGEIEY